MSGGMRHEQEIERVCIALSSNRCQECERTGGPPLRCSPYVGEPLWVVQLYLMSRLCFYFPLTSAACMQFISPHGSVAPSRQFITTCRAGPPAFLRAFPANEPRCKCTLAFPARKICRADLDDLPKTVLAVRAAVHEMMVEGNFRTCRLSRR